MKTILLAVILLTISIAAWSQSTIAGRTIDEHKKALIGAHVTIKEISAVTVSDELGNFTFKNIQQGTYTFEVSFIGYRTSSFSLNVTNGTTEFVEIVMQQGNVELRDIVISASAQQPVNALSQVDIQLRPTNNSQDILRMVPGLFIAQHAGGGKAEQIFLRGFDIDHGTDLNLEVDGMPVNMVSHAHGQGYSDLHFVIPEFIDYVNFDKGPYYADKGDFTTAGFVDFQTKNVLEDNFVKVEGGHFGTFRTVGGVNLFSKSNDRTTGYVGSEFFRTDGFVESPQDFARFNATSKISTRLTDRDNLLAGISFFKSKWDASGQIPTRAVKAGLITRFGSIDETEGGETSRANIFLKYRHQFQGGGYINHQAFVSRYDFNLFSNFTFFLNDAVNGDQIQQKESRTVYGYKSNYTTSGSWLGKELITDAGVGLRFDDIENISLSNTVRRSFRENVQLGDINETNVNAYVSETIYLTEKWSVNAALRLDHFQFAYSNALSASINKVSKTIVSPKVNVNFQLNPNTQLFLRSGLGFHSNDARVVTKQSNEILPRAYGIDLGFNAKVTDKLFVHAAIWGLDLDQEFVYVGDEGVVEPSGRSRRAGFDLSLRYEILPRLFFDGDLNLTRPKARDEAEGFNYIPLAPTVTTIGGLSYKMKNGLNGALRYRYIGDRAANESNTVIAKGYFIADAVVNYTKEKFEIGVSAENLFDIEWNEAQFDTESRLAYEFEPVSEIHFTPGTPLFVKLKAVFFF